MTDCNICLQTQNILIQLCPTCKCYCDKECLIKYINHSSFKCMICKKQAQRLKYFFAGKISLQDVGNHACSDFEKPNLNTRILVLDKNHFYNKDNSFKTNISGFLHSEKCAYWTEIDENEIYIDISNFLNLEEKLPSKKMVDYIIVGPTCIMDTSELFTINHGCWLNNPLLDTHEMVKTLNIRNNEMIEDCDVFSLEVDEIFSCYRSITEWGIAKEKGKILLIYFENNNKSKCAEFYTHIRDCLESVNKLDERNKELVIYCHPILKNLFSGFIEYKSYLEEIINLKK